MSLRVLASAVVVIALSSGGCKRRAPTSSEEHSATEAPKLPALDQAAAAEADDAIAAIQVRQQCNRVMGCAPAEALRALGAGVTPLVVRAVQGARPDAGYWVVQLLELLGELGDPRARPLLLAEVRRPRWERRARAALALAALGRAEEDPAQDGLEDALEDALEAVPEDDPASRAALLYALGRPAELNAALGLDDAALVSLNPGFYALLAELVGRTRAPAGLRLVRVGLVHRDRFVRRASIEAALALRDEGSIANLVGRLEDELPSIRTAAVHALKAITGRKVDAPAHWRAWCQHRRCLEDNPGRPPATPGATTAPPRAGSPAGSAP